MLNKTEQWLCTKFFSKPACFYQDEFFKIILYRDKDQGRSHHTRKEISMKKCLIALFLLFGTVAFAKTWEANLRSCDGYGGFWFPNHNWTDKGEPWIKPFMKGKILEDYNEMGLSFNYDEPEGVCTPPPCLTVENPIGLTYTPPASGKTMLLMDSVYFFETNCENDYATGGMLVINICR